MECCNIPTCSIGFGGKVHRCVCVCVCVCVTRGVANGPTSVLFDYDLFCAKCREKRKGLASIAGVHCQFQQGSV